MAAAHTEVCGCERFRLSDLSPAPVADEEELYFMVPHPEGLTANGRPNPAFLIQVNSDGLSVLRQGADNAEFEQTLTELAARWNAKTRKFHGVATFKTATV